MYDRESHVRSVVINGACGEPPRLPVVLNHTNAGFIIIDTRVTRVTEDSSEERGRPHLAPEHKPLKMSLINYFIY